MAGSGYGRYSASPKLTIRFAAFQSNQVPIEPSCVIRTRRITPDGAMDLLRRRHILGPTLSCPGLAAFDSGNPKRCGRSAGLEARAAGIALKRPASVASVGHLAPQHVSRVSLTGSRPGFDHSWPTTTIRSRSHRSNTPT